MQKEIIDEHGLFKPDRVNSDFLVAYALLRKDITTFSEDYAKTAHSEFLERVLRGIISLRFAGVDLNNKKEIEGRTERFRQLLPDSLHDKIESLRQDGGWADFQKFN